MIYFVPLQDMNFQLVSKYKPTGDQPEAIRQLTDGVLRGDAAQVLLGVTGSGKTFTVANVIANVNRPCRTTRRWQHSFMKRCEVSFRTMR